jgi:hypothetical protein
VVRLYPLNTALRKEEGFLHSSYLHDLPGASILSDLLNNPSLHNKEFTVNSLISQLIKIRRKR